MKVTVLKRDGKKEVINRVEVGIVAAAIEDGRIVNSVRRVREVYHLMSVHRQPDGQITTNWVGNQLGGWHPAAENMLCRRLPNAERRVEDDGL